MKSNKNNYDNLTTVRKKQRINWLGYLFVVPVLFQLGLFTIYPFIKTIVLSFTITNKLGKPTKFVGFMMWQKILTNSDFWKVVGVTFKIAGITLVGTFATALVFALISTRQVKGGRLYQTLFALPMAIATAPAAAVFLFVFRQSNGLMNSILGTDIAWLNNIKTAIWIVCLVTSWMHTGSSFLFLLVGFRNVPDELIESSLLDGANWWQRIIHILIPMASPQIFFVLFLNINSSFKSFAQIRLLTGGGPLKSTTTLVYYIYKNAILEGRFETACIQAIFLFLCIFAITRIQFALENKVVHYQ